MYKTSAWRLDPWKKCYYDSWNFGFWRCYLLFSVSYEAVIVVCRIKLFRDDIELEWDEATDKYLYVWRYMINATERIVVVVTLLTRIWEVIGSNFDQDIGYSDLGFRSFPLLPPGKFRHST